MSKFRKPNIQGLSHLRVIDSIWYQITPYNYLYTGSLQTIGIVKVRDTITGEIRFYIGAGKGEDIAEDEDLIIAGGHKFNLNNIFFKEER